MITNRMNYRQHVYIVYKLYICDYFRLYAIFGHVYVLHACILSRTSIYLRRTTPKIRGGKLPPLQKKIAFRGGSKLPPYTRKLLLHLKTKLLPLAVKLCRSTKLRFFENTRLVVYFQSVYTDTTCIRSV